MGRDQRVSCLPIPPYRRPSSLREVKLKEVKHMADDIEVKDVDIVHVEPAGEDAENVDIEQDEQEGVDVEKDTPSPSSDEEKPEVEQPQKEAMPQRQVAVEKREPKPVAGETPREYALRKEVERLRTVARGTMTKNAFGGVPPVEKKQAPTKSDVLGKYNPEEVQNFREVMEAVATDLGYVKKDEYQQSTYVQQREEILNQFVEQHPEYAPENDTDNVLWNQFLNELAVYKEPQNPKDYKKIFDRIHKDVFSIQSDPASLNKIKASQEKLKVASHSGASSNRPQAQKSTQPILDPSLKAHMKGFNDEELSEIFEG